MRRNRDDWRHDRPHYINFPISYFSQIKSAGDCLSVPSFKAMMGKIVSYGIAAEYRRTSSAWQNPGKYDGKLMQSVFDEMGIKVKYRESFFKTDVRPMMQELVQTRGKAFCGVPVPMALSFLNDDQSDYECVQFLAYCAIRSILGSAWADLATPSVKRITWEFILSRMAGFEKRVPVEQLPPHILYYVSKRHRARLRKSLTYKWHVQIDGQSRGKGGAFYMISDTMPIAEAIVQAKQARTIRREHKTRQAQAPS